MVRSRLCDGENGIRTSGMVGRGLVWSSPRSSQGHKKNPINNLIGSEGKLPPLEITNSILSECEDEPHYAGHSGGNLRMFRALGIEFIPDWDMRLGWGGREGEGDLSRAGGHGPTLYQLRMLVGALSNHET